MIENHNKITIPDVNGKNDLTIEVNWSSVPEIQGCKMFKVEINGQYGIIKAEDLFAILFALGSEEVKEKLMPVRSTTITKYYKQHRVVAKKDIKRGEELVVNCSINVPSVVREGFKFEIANKNKRSPLIYK